MTRLVGKNGSVKLDGSTVANITDWSMSVNPTFQEHRGAGMSAPAIYLDYAKRSGSFAYERATTDTAQTALVGTGVTTYTLLLDEGGSGTTYSFTAWVWGSEGVSRGGKVTGRGSFRES